MGRRRRQSDIDLPPRMHKRGETYWYVTSTTPRKWIKLGTDLAKARVKWALLENGGEGDDNPLFVRMMDEWAVSPAFEALAPTSRATYASAMKRLRGFFDGARLRDIKPQHVAAWLDNHPSRNQANIGRAIISNVMAIACRRGLIERNPCREIPPLRIKGRDRYITDAEYLAIHAAADPALRCAMDLAYLTGARISDVLKLRMADVTPEGVFIAQQKTGHKMLYALTPALADAIAAARALPRPVRGLTLICDRRGRQYKHGTFYELWTAACTAAGVKNAHFHDLRAKAGTDAKRQGRDHQALLGHADRKMSDRYVRAREVESIEPLPRIVEK